MDSKAAWTSVVYIFRMRRLASRYGLCPQGKKKNETTTQSMCATWAGRRDRVGLKNRHCVGAMRLATKSMIEGLVCLPQM